MKYNRLPRRLCHENVVLTGFKINMYIRRMLITFLVINDVSGQSFLIPGKSFQNSFLGKQFYLLDIQGTLSHFCLYVLNEATFYCLINV